MFIQTEETPNPQTLKFNPGREVSPEKSHSYENIEDTKNSPLARRMFSIEGVSAVFLGKDFVSISKSKSIDWQVMKPVILNHLMQHFMSNEKAVEIIIAKGVIWPIVVGSFKKDKYKIDRKSNCLDSRILDISIRLIIWVNSDNKSIVITMNFIFIENK